MAVKRPLLYIVVPCYNEEDVLPLTLPLFLDELHRLTESGRIDGGSRVLYVDDGSRDKSWELIRGYAASEPRVCGLRLSRNRGHQNALLAGLMAARERCDITISIDCDGQDDIRAMEGMVDEYLRGAEIVYGVRSSRASDKLMKRLTAEGYYKLLRAMGADVVYNHADYRLASSRALRSFGDFGEVNLFLRGLFPMVGYKTATVSYERRERLAGRTHYPLVKMLSLAADGITSLTIRPIRFITGAGALAAAGGFIGLLICLIRAFMGSKWGIAGLSWLIVFTAGVQLAATGVIGEYIGKVYLETKRRPRYIISETTFDGEEEEAGE